MGHHGLCILSGSSVHGISQVRMLEWVAIYFSRGSSQPRDGTHVSCIGRQILYHWANRETPCNQSVAAAAAKSLQPCLTLCDPIDGSLPGSSVHGIFQARDTGVGCRCLLQKVKLEEYKWRRCEALIDHSCLLKNEYFILETERKNHCWESLLLGLFYFWMFFFLWLSSKENSDSLFVGSGVSCLTLLKVCLKWVTSGNR